METHRGWKEGVWNVYKLMVEIVNKHLDTVIFFCQLNFLIITKQQNSWMHDFCRSYLAHFFLLSRYFISISILLDWARLWIFFFCHWTYYHYGNMSRSRIFTYRHPKIYWPPCKWRFHLKIMHSHSHTHTHTFSMSIWFFESRFFSSSTVSVLATAVTFFVSLLQCYLGVCAHSVVHSHLASKLLWMW